MMIEHFYSVKPTSLTLEDLSDVNVGESKQQTTGCGGIGNPTGDLWNAGFRYPQNGEFEWDTDLGEGCWTCTNHWGEECFDAGSGGRWGRRGKIKRREFKGDKLQCCLNNTKNPGAHKIQDGYTCDPNYRNPTSSDCRQAIISFCGVDNRIINDTRCVDLSSSDATTFNTLMERHCNSSDENAKGSKCINWCESNRTSCTRLNTIQNCEKYEIKTDCSAQKIVDIKTQCQKYGMLSEQGLPIGDYACTISGIDSLKKECDTYDLTDCTATGVSSAKVSAQSKEQADTALEQSKQQFEFTKTALAQVVGLPEDTIGETIGYTEKPGKSGKPDSQTMIIIIIVVLIIFILLSVSSSLLLVVK